MSRSAGAFRIPVRSRTTAKNAQWEAESVFRSALPSSLVCKVQTNNPIPRIPNERCSRPILSVPGCVSVASRLRLLGRHDRSTRAAPAVLGTQCLGWRGLVPLCEATQRLVSRAQFSPHPRVPLVTRRGSCAAAVATTRRLHGRTARLGGRVHVLVENVVGEVEPNV
jgi:hypothetical protein